MAKWWAVLFGVVMFACAVNFMIAPFYGWWLPEGVSTHAADVDGLFYFILVVTAFFFFLTEGIMVYFMWKYVACPAECKTEDAQSRMPAWLEKCIRPVQNLLHSQHRVEMAWTVVPAVLLLYIAFAQISAWAKIKYESRMARGEQEAAPLQVEVIAHQFGWRMRYPSPQRIEKWRKESWAPASDGKEARVKSDYQGFPKNPDMDDLVVVNELHTWVGHPVVVSLGTRDVLHSFNLPHLRVKQDALPGKTIPVWFTPTKSNTRFNPKTKEYEDGINPDTGKFDPHYIWDIACAELCGWGHYRMIGRIYVHKDYDEFLGWLKSAQEKQGK